jgi:hypothetical protein
MKTAIAAGAAKMARAQRERLRGLKNAQGFQDNEI